MKIFLFFLFTPSFELKMENRKKPKVADVKCSTELFLSAGSVRMSHCFRKPKNAFKLQQKQKNLLFSTRVCK